ncbi:MAG TPA: hypothetical protein VMD75_08085 [Candidatus Binataceae bacterium]|nr:hypothetical protein [Candidatus Binataceae bacterium]
MTLQVAAAKHQRIVGIASASIDAVRAPGGRDAQRPTMALVQSLFQLALVIAVIGAVIRVRLHLEPGWLALAASVLAFGGAIVFGPLEARRDPLAAPSDAALEALSMFGVFALFLAFYSATGSLNPSPYNAHVRQAFAFIHGHTYINAPNYIEHAQVGAFAYQLHPPLPAILMMPFAAIWGMNVNQTAFSMVFGALDIALVWRLLGRFRLNINARLWLTAFFGAGTILWYESVNGSSWALSMVVSIAFTVAALDEVFGPARPLRLGIFAGLAALARYDLAFDWPIYVLLEYRRRREVRPLFWMIPGFVLAGLIYVFLNEARYHSLFDRGVFIFAGRDQHLFGWQYLRGNFYTLMFMAPSLDDKFPYIHPRFVGQALLLTSPAFVLALRPSFKRLEAAAMVIAALVAMTPSLFYFTNGFSQFGTRHYLHAFPFLLVLMAMGVRRRADQMTRILIVLSILLIAYGVWHVANYGLS